MPTVAFRMPAGGSAGEQPFAGGWTGQLRSHSPLRIGRFGGGQHPFAAGRARVPESHKIRRIGVNNPNSGMT